MKKLLNTLSTVVCILGLSLNAQTNKSVSASSSENLQIDPNDSKANYIQNQNYLSTSSLKDYKSYFGDSLKGFNEAAAKAELVSRLYFGQEYNNVMNFMKRDFVNAKYKIGAYAPKPPKQKQQPVTPGTNPGKPIGGGNVVNLAPCVNEDFELTTPGNYNGVLSPVTGWTVESTNTNFPKTLACGSPTNGWITGSPEFSIVATPILGHPYIGNIPGSPLGGNNVALLNNTTPGFVSTRLTTTFPVTNANTLFQFAYAGSWDGSGHLCCDQPFFTITMFDCTGNPLGCSTISLTPPGASCVNGATGYSTTPGGISWCNWQIKYIDLTPYIGSCVTLKVTNGDCNGGAHHGSLYFDAKCGGSLICGNCSPPSGSVTTIPGPVSFCAGAGIAQITAPTGYATYSWIAPPGAPPIAPASSTLQTLSISNPVIGTIYTVNLVSMSGCLFTSTNAIGYSSVNIALVATLPSCSGGASGSGTVVGNGSGNGYNYNWYNSTNSVVGTQSVVTGLAAGIYTIVISGAGAAGCGSAAATVTVGTAPPGVQNFFKPYCGNVAYLGTAGGTNFQWYSGPLGLTAVTNSLGGNQPTFTVNNPSSGQVVTLTYLSIYGCQDSVRFTMAATAPGFLAATQISSVCVGGNNGTAIVNLVPAQGTPPGLNVITVGSTGTTPPFTASSGPSQVASIPLSGLSAGTYTMKAFDGSCYYQQSFNVSAYVFAPFTVGAAQTQLCPGNSIQSSVAFTNPGLAVQFTYSWSPSTWLIGTNAQQTIVNPSIPVGSSVTTHYSVTVKPIAINCPVTKTIDIIAVNPPVPTITAIPNLCNNSPLYNILTNPAGGTFNSGFSSNSPISPNGGVISPSNTNIAIGFPANTFTYNIIWNGCPASKTATYLVSQYNTAALTAAVPPLCVTNAPFNLMNIVQNTSGGSWSGPGVSSNQFIPANVGGNVVNITYMRPSTPVNTCPSTTTIPVVVTNTSVPVIPSVPEFCTSFPPFSLTATPIGGGWIPTTGVNNAGVVTPANITSQNLTVTYTVTDGPCLNTNTSVLNISTFHPATLSGTVNNLCYNSPPFNLLSIVQNSTGSWSDYDPANPGVPPVTNAVLTNSFFAAGLNTGIYNVKYHVPSTPNTTLCPDTRTLSIFVLSPPQPTITQVGPYCNNASPVQLTVTPTSGYWTQSTYVNASGVFDPALSPVGTNMVQYIVGSNTCNRVAVNHIGVEAFVPATIISTIPDLCNNSPILNLTPFTISNQGTWSGTGITGTSFNPGLTGSGNFNLSYHTSSSPSGMCPDVKSISVNVYSLAVPAVTKVGPLCDKSLPVQLQVSPVGGLFGGAIPGLISLNGAFNPASALIGNNVVTYSITSGPCVAYAQSTIEVVKFVSAAFAKLAGPFCENDGAFNMNSIALNPGGQWFGQGMAMTGGMFTPGAANVGNLTIITYSTHPEKYFDLCPDTRTLSIEVRKNPTPQAITTSTTGGCLPLEITFTAPGLNYAEGSNWSINDNTLPIKSTQTTHLFTSPGTYNIQFNYTDEIGCKALPQTTIVKLDASPKADFTAPEEIYISDPQVQLTNQSSVLSNNTYKWNIANLAQPTELSPTFTFPKIGKYQVTLTATSLYGCKDEITKTIEVKNNFNIFIPNSFSPNFDGINDFFIPVYTKEGIDTKAFEMEIYDRWGHSIYRTRDITKGWDGSVQNKGEPLKEDVYIYKVKYKDAEGNLYEKMGNISLLK